MLPKVAIVILNWNGWHDTVDLLASLHNATYDPLLIIVVENASTDGQSLTTIKEWVAANNVPCTFHLHTVNASTHSMLVLSQVWETGSHYLIIESQYNLGFCAGNNLGMNCAAMLGADYILILNNDTLVQPNFLEPMVVLASSDSKIGLVGGVITYYDNPQLIWWAGGTFDRTLTATRQLDHQPLTRLPLQKTYPTELVSGCMMLIPTRIFRQFGGYPEEYFIWSEEWDYSYKVAKAGYRHMVARESRICHKIGHTLGVMTPLNYYYGLRNGLLFRQKYLPWYIWYPYFAYYLLNRIVRFSQLLLQGRSDLVRAGMAAISDFILRRTGVWQRQISR